MTRPFLIPRVFAAASAVCVASAAAVPLAGYDWRASAGLLVCAVACGWLARDMAETHRRGLRLARSARRRDVAWLNERSRHVAVLKTTLPQIMAYATTTETAWDRDDWSRKVADATVVRLPEKVRA